MTVELSCHAINRAQQRGVPHATIELILDHADIVIPVGAGCSALRVSRRQILDQSLRGELRGCVDRLAHIAVVRSDHTGEIVTVLHDRGGRRGRRYRRPH